MIAPLSAYRKGLLVAASAGAATPEIFPFRGWFVLDRAPRFTKPLGKSIMRP
jgi:hypothetical protein